ncbi:MAG: Rpn family recombination-promoting nuclease/putative transposase, partial [Bacteroidales bacterium]|nr:Rpn family recombination-promoting nuclease/putative transposase [Bacteroidales bacterium]
MNITTNSGSKWHPKYIDPATDFGFKRIFKDEEITRGFLNDLIQKDDPTVNITSVTITDGEFDETNKDSRRVVYDVYCVTDSGEEFIIEMQNDSQDFFAERIVFYLARAASRQQSKGYLNYIDANGEKKKKDWDYHLKNIYGVFFMNFKDKDPEHAEPLSHFLLMEKEKHYVDTDVIQYWKIQMPFYRKMKESDCKNSIDKWIFNLSNMSTMETNLAFTDEKPLFMRLQELASYSALTPQQQIQYDYSFQNFMCYL